MTNDENDSGVESDDLEVGGVEDSESFDDFEGGGGVSPLSNPMVKVGIIVAAVATLIGGIVLFGGKEEVSQQSLVRGAEKVESTPGMEVVSPQMREAIQQSNEEDAEKAARTGNSSIPVPISSPQETLSVPDLTSATDEDPLERWRKIQEERQKREALLQRPDRQEVDPNAQVVSTLAESMSEQMQTILDAQTIEKPESETISPEDWIEQQAEEKAAKLQEQIAAANASSATNVAPIILDILQPAGTIEYAQLITEANSDAPGPVLAQIMSGPLRGSRILGTFETKDRYLTLSFNTVVVDGVSYAADAIALDPSSANPGLVTEMDRRYFERIILPAAAAFVEGMGEAIAESGTTTVAVSGGASVSSTEPLDTKQEIYKGVAAASGKASEIFDEEADDVKPLIKVHAGTAVGILFMQPVTKDAATKAN